MMNNLMKSLEPHGRTGTSEDLKPDSGAFTGSARTLDGVLPACCQRHAARRCVVSWPLKPRCMILHALK